MSHKDRRTRSKSRPRCVSAPVCAGISAKSMPVRESARLLAAAIAFANGELIVVEKPVVIGREVLTLAGLLPAENYTLRVKLSGEKPRKVELDETVDLPSRSREIQGSGA